jgi:acetoin utilization deacetylase AcuC-like enzyme/formylglycine-generating enzyme required for sulfatase activity
MNARTILGAFLLASLIVCAGCKPTPPQAPPPETATTPSGIEMVAIPGGWFQMGSRDGEPDEAPVHRVRISPFWMDRHEVVQSEFRKYELPDPSHFKDPNHPLEQINWTDAALYCNERSLAEGLEPCYDEETWHCDFDANGYRLPTEAEWEYACRAGTDSAYSFGNAARELSDYAWYAANSGGSTHWVARKKPNARGLYDMHGNVAEWCNDWYSPTYYEQSPTEDPTGPGSGTERVLRGGAWNSSAPSCRSAYRASDPSLDDTCLASDAIGFRCVRRASTNESETKEAMTVNASKSRPSTGFVFDDVYLRHRVTEGHPERPERLTAIVQRLKETGLYDRLTHIAPAPAEPKWLQTIHTPAYIERVERSCKEGDRYLDSADVPISTMSFEAAVTAAGGVLAAVDAVKRGDVRNAFCAVRPPGHHALSDEAMGFCIFNNVAIGTRYAQQKHGLTKVLIVDWDVHHGNATQAAFYDDPNVLYFSVHQYPFYPGSGTEEERGSAGGKDLVVNVPLPAGSGDDVFIAAFEDELRPAALAFDPDFTFISAGFDAHEDDTLGGMRVTAEGFGKLTRIVQDIVDRCCAGRVVSVLEGGYGLDGLAASVEAHLLALME